MISKKSLFSLNLATALLLLCNNYAMEQQKESDKIMVGVMCTIDGLARPSLGDKREWDREHTSINDIVSTLKQENRIDKRAISALQVTNNSWWSVLSLRRIFFPEEIREDDNRRLSCWATSDQQLFIIVKYRS